MQVFLLTIENNIPGVLNTRKSYNEINFLTFQKLLLFLTYITKANHIHKNKYEQM